MSRNKNLKYAFCDDWFIYAVDEKGKLYYVITETWTEWLDLHKNADQEPNAVEKYMLPIALKKWDRLNFKETDSYINDTSKLKIVFKKPGEKPIVMEIEHTLEKLQELVEGYIEVVPANDDGSILMIVNEEGLLKELKPNVWIGQTCIVGNVIFVQNGNDGEFHSLTGDMVRAIIEIL